MRYDNEWWSVDYPDDWQVEDDGVCTSFHGPEGTGVLQIRTSHKDSAVTDLDLLETARERAAAGITISPVATAALTGYSAAHTRANNAWLEWWLRGGDTMLHATYVCSVDDAGSEEETVARIVQTLRLRKSA